MECSYKPRPDRVSGWSWVVDDGSYSFQHDDQSRSVFTIQNGEVKDFNHQNNKHNLNLSNSLQHKIVQAVRYQEAEARNKRALKMLYDTETEYEIPDGLYAQGHSNGGQCIYTVQNNQATAIHDEDIYGNQCLLPT